jgi:hypothetical protein
MSISKFSLTLAALLLGAIVSNQALALVLPGITPSGHPAFGNGVKVALNPNNGTIKATGRKNFLLALDDSGSNVLQGTSGAYSLQVNFDKNTREFMGGSVSLKGAIDALGISKNTLLMSADITGFNILSDQMLWGFNTTNIFCSPELQLNCTNSESVYIELDSAFNGLFERNFRTTGFATTTIPIPAAAWLFGSALGLLGWARRRAAASTLDGTKVSG